LILRPGPSAPPVQSGGCVHCTTCLPFTWTLMVSPLTMMCSVNHSSSSAADLLKLGQHVDAAIRTGARHYVHFQLEISEAVVAKAAVIVTVARRAIGDDGPVLEREGRSRTADLPACEVLAVEQTGPAGLVLSKANRSVLSEDGRTPDDCGHGDQKHESASSTHLFLPSGRPTYSAA